MDGLDGAVGGAVCPAYGAPEPETGEGALAGSMAGSLMAERFGLDPVIKVGEGRRAVPMARHPITFSATPAHYELPPPELDEHGPELRKWLASPQDPQAIQKSSRD